MRESEPARGEGRPSRWLGRNLEEIAQDRALCWFGAALALVNAVTAVFWLTRQPVADMLAPSVAPVCWPFFEGCYRWRVLTPNVLDVLVVSLLVVAVVNAALFVRPGTAVVAYWLLAAVSAFKFALIAQDYRLVLNQHYMALWTVAVFLFAPAKRWALPCLLVLFYMWAGTLKLNADWLSGNALNGSMPLGVAKEWVPFACAYVVVLELVVAPMLLARNRYVFLAALAQFLLFHTVSYGVVGFFYPALMFLLLSVFVLFRLFPNRAGGSADVTPVALVRMRGPLASYALILMFSAFQIGPRLLPGDIAVTGEGRMFALNMFDAPVECIATARHHLETSEVLDRRIRPAFLQARIKCDPIIYFEASKFDCLRGRDDLPSPDFDLTIRSRRHGEPEFRTVASIPNFCSSNPTYSMVRHNEWISAR